MFNVISHKSIVAKQARVMMDQHGKMTSVTTNERIVALETLDTLGGRHFAIRKSGGSILFVRRSLFSNFNNFCSLV